MTETHAPFGMTPEIAAAICTVMKKVRRLEKDDKNKFDNYNFTSVDKFFEFVNPLMAEAGLMVHYDETGQEYYTNKKESLWMRSRFAIYLCHESGAMAGPFNRTVAVPMTGAQSYGSAQSYALKQFLRATFLIPTGEKDDADHNAKDEHQAAPQKDYATVPNGDWTVPDDPGLATGVKGANPPQDATAAEKARAYANAIIQQLWEAKTQRGVDGVWRKNEAVIARLKESYDDLYQSILDATKKREEAIGEPAEEDA